METNLLCLGGWKAYFDIESPCALPQASFFPKNWCYAAVVVFTRNIIHHQFLYWSVFVSFNFNFKIKKKNLCCVWVDRSTFHKKFIRMSETVVEAGNVLVLWLQFWWWPIFSFKLLVKCLWCFLCSVELKLQVKHQIYGVKITLYMEMGVVCINI